MSPRTDIGKLNHNWLQHDRSLFGELINDDGFIDSVVSAYNLDDAEASTGYQFEDAKAAELAGVVVYTYTNYYNPGPQLKDVIPVYKAHTHTDDLYAAAVKFTDGDIAIIANQTFHGAYMSADRWQPIIRAMMAHEVGHILAGHLDSDVSNKSTINVPFRENVIALLKGGYSQKELEANVVATCLLGNDASSLIFMYNKMSLMHKNRGVKIEHINNCFALIDFLRNMRQSPDQITGIVVNSFDYVPLDEDTLESIKSKEDSDVLENGKHLEELED